MSNKQVCGIVVIAAARVLLLCSAVQSGGVYQQRIEQVNLREVCQYLDDIRDDIRRWNCDAKTKKLNASLTT